MICVTVTPPSTVAVVACDTPGAYALLTVNEATGQDLQLLGITSESVAQVWGWGFAMVLFFWFLGYSVGVAKKLIGKV